MTQKKMGRPTENPKSNSYRIRMDDDFLMMLEFVANEKNITKAEAFRQGIEIQYEGLKNK